MVLEGDAVLSLDYPWKSCLIVFSFGTCWNHKTIGKLMAVCLFKDDLFAGAVMKYRNCIVLFLLALKVGHS